MAKKIKATVITHELLQTRPQLYDKYTGLAYAVYEWDKLGSQISYRIYNDTTYSDGSKAVAYPATNCHEHPITYIKRMFTVDKP